ncbi:MAG: CDP-alcohol phosphatidyltransferase family protein [Planctomycetota bacterium]|nr:CDP-alcohol phosphatidyltransferase family protein [Planctomycetota bacterium]
MKPSEAFTHSTLAKDNSNVNSLDREGMSKHKYVTIPNIICTIRLIGSIWLFWVAMQDRPVLFTWVFVALSLSDTVDGRIARWFNLRSDFGARLDSFADSVLYGAMFFGLFWFRGDVLIQEALWWIVGLLSYVLTTGAGLCKYGRIPSYHTRGAKISQWFVLAGAVCLLLDYTVWPFRLAMFLVTLTNLEATAITWILPKWRADVLTILHVWPSKNSDWKEH